MWLEREEQWAKLAEHVEKAGEYGFDTETYDQPDKTSPQHRARIHCWSVGVLTDTRSPRGYRRAVGRVLPREALHHPAWLRVFANPNLVAWSHNAPHDVHSSRNEGVTIARHEDSLQYLRVAVPGRNEYGLKAAEFWALGYGPRPSFMEMVSYKATVVNSRRRRESGCICGKNPCRARSTSDWLDVDGVWRPHTRVAWSVFAPYERQVPARYAVTDFVPGAALAPLTWEPTRDKPSPPGWWKGTPIDRLAAWWDYSLADSVRGMELVDWIRNQKPTRIVYPWTAQTAA